VASTLVRGTSGLGTTVSSRRTPAAESSVLNGSLRFEGAARRSDLSGRSVRDDGQFATTVSSERRSACNDGQFATTVSSRRRSAGSGDPREAVPNLQRRSARDHAQFATTVSSRAASTATVLAAQHDGPASAPRSARNDGQFDNESTAGHDGQFTSTVRLDIALDAQEIAQLAIAVMPALPNG